MNQRLTRKEMKRDEVMEGLSHGVHFLQEHARTIVIALVAVFAALAGLGIWKTVTAGQAERANTALSGALSGVAAEGGEIGSAREALQGVVDEYGSTAPGAVAQAYLGTIAAGEPDFEAARRHWESFLAQSPDNALAAGVERNLMSLDRAEGKDEALAERLRAALATGSSALAEDTILYELARTLEDLGQLEGASETYDRLLEEHPTSLFAAKARQRSSALQAS